MKLFVKNLDRDINEMQLEGLFAQFGEVLSTKVVYDKITWESKGFAFVEMAKKTEAHNAIDALNGIGLYAEIIENQLPGSGDNSCDIAVAKSQELIDELQKTKSNEQHRHYGELMGYPSTAIDAFLEENGATRLSFEEQEELTKDLPDVLTKFGFSRQNTEEELAKLKKWFKLIAQHAPELFDELYLKEDSDKFKKIFLEIGRAHV